MELPTIKIEGVKSYLAKYPKSQPTVKRGRDNFGIRFENIIVDDLFFGRGNRAKRTLFVQVSEVLRGPRKTKERHHYFEVKFSSESENAQEVVCTKCGEAKASCSANSTFIDWIQSIQPGADQENVAPKENIITSKTKDCYILIKKAPTENVTGNKTKECFVLVKKENMSPISVVATPEAPALKKLKKEPMPAAPKAPALRKLKKEPIPAASEAQVLKKLEKEPIPSPLEAPVLTKLKKEPIPVSPLQLESAQKLSMISLVREFEGKDPDQFLKFCTDRMVQANNCSSVELLTVEQADTDLWHELRKGRITASRMYEASRCTMLNGSLTNKIMGISSGFSFAMKRGTDLEGHVFAVLQKEYPGLRNAGLVLDPQFPWMGASPDGICDEFVLEIKCPYTQKTYDSYVDVKKLSKKYFAQIQLQMHMTHRTKALLGVAALDFETTKNVTKVWIDYDKTYVDQIMAESYEFWCKAVFKALLKKRSSKK